MLIRKAVIFNPDDADQRKMIEHIATRTNFSAYMKRLIQRDMEGVIMPATIKEEFKTEFDAEGFI